MTCFGSSESKQFGKRPQTSKISTTVASDGTRPNYVSSLAHVSSLDNMDFRFYGSKCSRYCLDLPTLSLRGRWWHVDQIRWIQHPRIQQRFRCPNPRSLVCQWVTCSFCRNARVMIWYCYIISTMYAILIHIGYSLCWCYTAALE